MTDRPDPLDAYRADPDAFDAGIAVEIMGWHSSGQHWSEPCRQRRGRRVRRKCSWQPTAKVADAWAVIEKLCGSLSKWRIGWEEGRVVEDVYECVIPHPASNAKAGEPRRIVQYGGSWEQAFVRAVAEWLAASEAQDVAKTDPAKPAPGLLSHDSQ